MDFLCDEVDQVVARTCPSLSDEFLRSSENRRPRLNHTRRTLTTKGVLLSAQQRSSARCTNDQPETATSVRSPLDGQCCLEF